MSTVEGDEQGEVKVEVAGWLGTSGSRRATGTRAPTPPDWAKRDEGKLPRCLASWRAAANVFLGSASVLESLSPSKQRE